jgi:hypothetical protein
MINNLYKKEEYLNFSNKEFLRIDNLRGKPAEYYDDSILT